jgi:hypothetical protein
MAETYVSEQSDQICKFSLNFRFKVTDWQGKIKAVLRFPVKGTTSESDLETDSNSLFILKALLLKATHDSLRRHRTRLTTLSRYHFHGHA